MRVCVRGQPGVAGCTQSEGTSRGGILYILHGFVRMWQGNRQYLQYLEQLLKAAATVHDTAQQRQIAKVPTF